MLCYFLFEVLRANGANSSGSRSSRERGLGGAEDGTRSLRAGRELRRGKVPPPQLQVLQHGHPRRPRALGDAPGERRPGVGLGSLIVSFSVRPIHFR